MEKTFPTAAAFSEALRLLQNAVSNGRRDLAEALDPINDRLAQSARDTGWERVCIMSDMRVTMGLREYRLLSESEKWRADAMLAEAVSCISKIGLLVLDRFDVLDLDGRQVLIGWLDVLAQEGEINNALIFGTLKALPANLPETIGAHWLENGVLPDEVGLPC